MRLSWRWMLLLTFPCKKRTLSRSKHSKALKLHKSAVLLHCATTAIACHSAIRFCNYEAALMRLPFHTLRCLWFWPAFLNLLVGKAATSQQAWQGANNWGILYTQCHPWHSFYTPMTLIYTPMTLILYTHDTHLYTHDTHLNTHDTHFIHSMPPMTHP